MHSSSGGVFSILAEQTIKQGGVVFGARFDENWEVKHDYTETIDGVSVFRGSKYVQSKTGDTFKQAEQFLKQNRKVLFSGTPCQIVALKRYLKKEYENLIYPSLLVRVKLQDSRFDPHFIAHYLNSTIVRRALSTELSGTTIPMINVGNVNEIKIPLIDINKQKKVVEFLKLAHQENELLQNLINEKQKYSKDIFEILALQGE
jgi:restriction endonuclease S subunit